MENGLIEIIKYENLIVNNFEQLINSINIENHNIIIDFPILIDQMLVNKYGDYLKFKNCVFSQEIKVKDVDNPAFELIFVNCKFLNTLLINNNTLRDLKLVWYLNNSTSENYSTIYSKFENEINISNNTFLNNCKISRINIIDGNFLFIGNKFLKEPREIYSKSKIEFTVCEISNSTINNGSFNNNIFYLPFDFRNNILNYNVDYTGHTFKNNLFQKTFFSGTDFGQFAEFFECDFYGTTLFDKIKNIRTTDLHFRNCKFTGFTHFSSSKINTITFDYVLFERNVSFKDSNFNLIKFEEVKFEKGAFFDDLNKNNSNIIINWDRNTLREIKRELVNSHNQIDYLRFKAYELEAYKKEKGKSWKDSFILFFNEQSNYFGLDWFKGLKFTLYTSFICYLLYIITFAIVIKSIVHLPNSVEDFFVNYLNFLNPFSFLKSPIDESEKYFFPFLFFIIGKIFVSYGIYQTAQAFRKFGVSGG